MSDLVTRDLRGHVCVILIDNPPVNALSLGVPEGIAASLDEVSRNHDVRAVVIAGAGRTFIAGADITTLERAAWGDLAVAPNLHALVEQIETCQVPVVMALHGTVLGGGNEVAMAGHYRVAAASVKIGQPEVNLGLIPGAEGTQRLPRLVGVEKALDMCVGGHPIRAADALAAGLVDAVVEGDIVDEAVAFARNVAAHGGPHPRTSERGDRLGDPVSNAPLFAAARAQAARTRARETAPLRVVQAIDAATMLPFDAGCRREREIFFDCLEDEQARALIYRFFAERAAAKSLARRQEGVNAIAPNGPNPLESGILSAYTAEIDSLVAQGVAGADITRSLTTFGMSPASVVTGTARHADHVTARALAESLIVDRVVYAMVNAGARALTEGLADQAADVDVAASGRSGFPHWRGGPLFYADRVGLDRVLVRIRAYHAEFGDRWQPAPLLEQLVAEGRTFRDRDRIGGRG